MALVVSGGHTNLYRVQGFLDMALLGRTRDDAAGEAFDKVAKLLGLGYPGGVIIEKLAAQGNPEAFSLPRPRIPEEPLTFSFSGLKTAVAHQVKKHPEILTDPRGQADLAAGFQEAVVDSLVSRAFLALEATDCTAWWSAAAWRPTAACARSWEKRLRPTASSSFSPPLPVHGQRGHGRSRGLPPAPGRGAPGPVRGRLFPGLNLS